MRSTISLYNSGSDVRKRQEIGRGLRLCVNQDGERMDTNVLGNDVHNVNVLTVIASESYDSFAKGLQCEIAEAVADRPKAVTAELFIDKVIKDDKGNEQVVDGDTGRAIYFDLIVNGYIDKKGVLTDKYFEDKANGEIKVTEEVQIQQCPLSRLSTLSTTAELCSLKMLVATMLNLRLMKVSLRCQNLKRYGQRLILNLCM